MHVNINLLQKKKMKYEWLIIGVVIFIVALILFFYLYSQSSAKKAVETQVLTSIQNELTIQNAASEQNVIEESDEVKLANLVEWGNQQQVPTVFLLDHLTSLMPERGFISSFTYSSSSSVSLRVQFDSNVEAAYYLKRLKDSPYITSAVLSSIESVESGESTATNDATYYQPHTIGNYELMMNIDAVKAVASEEEVSP